MRIQRSHLSARQKRTKQGDVRMLSNKLWSGSFVAIMWSNLCQTAVWYRSHLCCAMFLICAILSVFATMATHRGQPWSHEEVWSLTENFGLIPGHIWPMSDANDAGDWFGPGQTVVQKGAEAIKKAYRVKKIINWGHRSRLNETPYTCESTLSLLIQFDLWTKQDWNILQFCVCVCMCVCYSQRC